MATATGATSLLLLVAIGMLSSPALSDFVISKLDRKIDLTSQIVRSTSVLKSRAFVHIVSAGPAGGTAPVIVVQKSCYLIENFGPDFASNFFLAIPNYQAKKLAYLKAYYSEGTRKTKGNSIVLHGEVAEPEGMPPEVTIYSLSLPQHQLEKKSFTIEVLTVFTHSLAPFPEEITQADIQLVLFQDSSYFLSPYFVKTQSLRVVLPSSSVESFTKLQNAKLVGSEIKYGPYEDIPAFNYNPIVVHFENNNPFPVARELIREIEISHWGSVQITEDYNLIHAGAQNKGGFSRFDYQIRHTIRGSSVLNRLLARLPPRAHSVYYRDEIGNVSTSHLWSTSRKTELLIEPRYPMFGGWKTSFTIGYGLPLQDFLFERDGQRFLNITFGCPIDDVVIDNLIVKVVLPEGSKEINAVIPFHTRQWQEMKYSQLDTVGRPVVVIEKANVVPELNQHFQVYYSFNNLSLLIEPLMLVSGFFFFFVACITCMHTDISISKSSASYLAKQQLDEVQAAIQQVQNIVNQCLAVHDKLEVSLRDLSRTGDVQSCKTIRKTADRILKDLMKELKTLLMFLQSAPQAAQIWPKVDELITKEKEMQEKLMLKHSSVVDSFEKKHSAREMDSRIAPIQQKLVTLREEIDELVEAIDEF